ncbi:hypothetical protein RFI_26988 [Reticulomyxa filosa]|uniref:Uncharacterized protein n=1 Tax=Reticulomyxa filosa TaxID=46433 RepID=X6MBJ6_RETFI|nr:hypothetical protein RFI_26988 [Reticulomyxa filosa]|eukprot:ETO10390.1 hypothetical protein RFI_26988 [Reticulomyxa filosa]
MNFSGRLCAGRLKDKYQRIASLMAIGALMCVLHGSICFIHNPYILLFNAMTIGSCFGWLFGTIVVISCELWGNRYIAGNYAALDFSPSLGSVIFATLTAGELYAYQQNRQAHPNDDNYCYGVQCFRYCFAICSFSSTFKVDNSYVKKYNRTIIHLTSKYITSNKDTTSNSEIKGRSHGNFFNRIQSSVAYHIMSNSSFFWVGSFGVVCGSSVIVHSIFEKVETSANDKRRRFVLGCVLVSVGINFLSYYAYPDNERNVGTKLDPIRRGGLWSCIIENLEISGLKFLAFYKTQPKTCHMPTLRNVDLFNIKINLANLFFIIDGIASYIIFKSKHYYLILLYSSFLNFFDKIISKIPSNHKSDRKKNQETDNFLKTKKKHWDTFKKSATLIIALQADPKMVHLHIRKGCSAERFDSIEDCTEEAVKMLDIEHWAPAKVRRCLAEQLSMVVVNEQQLVEGLCLDDNIRDGGGDGDVFWTVSGKTVPTQTHTHTKMVTTFRVHKKNQLRKRY